MEIIINKGIKPNNTTAIGWSINCADVRFIAVVIVGRNALKIISNTTILNRVIIVT